MKIIDPSKIKQSDLPMLVFASNTRSFISWRIRAVTNEPYNHVMRMNKVGCFDSQNPGGYKRIPLESYVNGYNKLKFVYFPDVPTEKRLKLIDLASKRIMKIKKKKWWNPFGRYDYLGLIGQRLGIRWLQNPFKDFCSEREIKDINKAFKWGIKERLNPGELNDILKTLAKSKTYGYYVPED